MNKLVVLGSVNADHVLQVPYFPRRARLCMDVTTKLSLAVRGQTKR